MSESEPAEAPRELTIGLIADVHGRLRAPKGCDLLAIAGDLVPFDTVGDAARQRQFVEREMVHQVERLDAPAERIAATLGNHEALGQTREGMVLLRSLAWRLLMDEGAQIAGLSVWGSPWSVGDGKAWAFQAPDDELDEHYGWIPQGLGLLITHGSPYGIQDQTQSGRHVGSHALRRHLERTRPRLHVFGHIHNGGGAELLTWPDGSTTLCVNATMRGGGRRNGWRIALPLDGGPARVLDQS